MKQTQKNNFLKESKKNEESCTRKQTEKCDKEFRKLKKHLGTVHGEVDKSKCNICTKEFMSEYYLIIHITKQFMKDIEITIVNLVANHFLKEEL